MKLIKPDGVEVPPEVIAHMERVAAEVDMLFHKIETENGKPYAEAVRAMVTVREMQTILGVGGAPEPMMEIITRMLGGLYAVTLNALGQEKNLTSIEAQADDIMDRLRPSNGSEALH